MIGSLSGSITAIYPPFVLLDVNGVGYEIETPMSTFCQLQKDANVFLWTHLVVREDAQLLYGFSQQSERSVFRTLIKINGVGAKLAIAILSSIELPALKHALENDDAARLTKIPGIGKKTAERLIIELRGKLDHVAGSTENAGTDASEQKSASGTRLAESEAIAALQSLGYSAKEAEKVIDSVSTEEATTQQLIRLALKQLAK